MNKGAFSYPERFRGESFHGFPSKNKQPLFFGFPSVSEIYDFKCDANTANFAFRITLAAEAGARIIIDKGNGESVTVIGTGGNVNVDWIYPQPGQYNINLNGETNRITGITINNRRLIGNLSQSFVDKITNIQVFNISSNQFSGELPSFASCVNLSVFQCYSNQFSGELPSFASCVNLSDFRCSANQFSGELPSFSTCTSLVNFQCNSNQFSGLPSIFNMTINATILQMQLNNFTSFQQLIDNFYQNKGLRSSVLDVNLSGTNNATPGGIFQAPAGYVQAGIGINGNDGTPVSEKEQIYVLVNQNIDNSTTKKYKYLFTTN